MLTHRCLIHAEREAVGLCMECRQSFCRECVTEHDGRMICARCLARLTRPAEVRRRDFAWLTGPVLVLTGLVTAWLFFHVAGLVLLALPSAWHEGTIWQELYQL